MSRARRRVMWRQSGFFCPNAMDVQSPRKKRTKRLECPKKGATIQIGSQWQIVSTGPGGGAGFRKPVGRNKKDQACWNAAGALRRNRLARVSQRVYLNRLTM